MSFNCSLYLYISNTVLIGGDDSLRVTPVPIPNTEVKSLDADGTAGEAQWESRLSPPFLFFWPDDGLKPKPALCFLVAYASTLLGSTLRVLFYPHNLRQKNNIRDLSFEHRMRDRQDAVRDGSEGKHFLLLEPTAASHLRW